MQFGLFFKMFPDVAARETRTLHIEESPGIPAGQYAFIESYCIDPSCDCERVMLSVTEKRQGIVATISYGFNSAKFPAWLDGPNPFLDPLNPQSDYAEELLEMFEEIVLDDEYKGRLERHYRMVKEFKTFAAAMAADQPRTSRGSTLGEARRRTATAKQLRKRQKAARRRNRAQ